MLEAGREVGGYRVDGLIGTGSMGSVYQVTHVDRETVHALKFLPLASSRQKARLWREADLLVRLSHPNVVSLVEVIDVDGDPGLVMEFVKGPTLASWLPVSGLTPQDAEALFVQIAAGVAHAHRRGIVHRDLKPSNIVLTKAATGIVPKVADFGVARVFIEDTDEHDITESGASVGSPAYMAPEQIDDPRDVDQRADVFAMGCLLYELVSGQRAFPQEGAAEVMNAIVEGRVTPVHEVVPDVPDRFRRAIHGALERDRRRRIGDIDQLLDVLTEGGSVTPVSMSPRPLDEPESTSAYVLRLVTIAIVALLVGVLLALVYLR